MKTCRSYTLLLLAPAADVDNAESSVADPGKTKVSAVVALAESSLGVAPVSVPVGSSGGGMGVKLHRGLLARYVLHGEGWKCE